MSILKKCVICSKEFTAKNDKGIYCSPSCRVKAHRRREKEGKTELEKNISEEYAAELSHFRSNLNIMYDEVQYIKKGMAAVERQLISFVDRLVKMPQVDNTYKLENKIEDLSEETEAKINELKDNFEDVTYKNEYDIKSIKLKINEFADAINRINNRTNYSASNNSKVDIIDKILDSNMIPDLVDKLVNRQAENDY